LADESANEVEVWKLPFLDALPEFSVEHVGSVPELPFGALHLGLKMRPLQHVPDGKRPSSVNPVAMTPLSSQELLN
jgi:hypothetical protein